MTRWIGFLLAVCLTFTACAPSAPTPVVSGFRCQVDVNYGGVVYSGTLDRADPTATVLTLTEPSAMNGMTMRLADDGITVQYLGMEMTVSEDTLPVGALVRVLCDTLDAAVKQAGVSPSTRMEGESLCGAFTLTFEESSGLPRRLEVPAVAFSADFSAWETPSE